jgi:transcriptional regulator with XRE-family HTH domain
MLHSPHGNETNLRARMKRLKEIRRQRGLSQEQLADLSGVSRATIARIETQDDYLPREVTIDRLAEALGVFNVELFADDEFDFPFGPEQLIEMGGEQITQLLGVLGEGGRLSLNDAAERMKWTAIRRAGNARRLPEGPDRDDEMKRAFQATYFWGYLDGHGDHKKYLKQLEIADRLDKMEEEMRKFKERSKEAG